MPPSLPTPLPAYLLRFNGDMPHVGGIGRPSGSLTQRRLLRGQGPPELSFGVDQHTLCLTKLDLGGRVKCGICVKYRSQESLDN